MSVEKIRKVSDDLEKLAEWAGSSTYSTPVSVSEKDYKVNLGAVGEVRIPVKLSKKVDLKTRDIFSAGPVNFPTLQKLYRSLREIATELESTPPVTNFEEVLASLRARDAKGALLADAFEAIVRLQGSQALEPLPKTPAPWPGSLRTDIDYTTSDFPLRYQPPPGFDWATATTQRVIPQDAILVSVKKLRERPERGVMILDSQGRVSWIKRDGDELLAGGRWQLWFLERDGIPANRGNFNSLTPPLALAQDGTVLPQEGQALKYQKYSAAWRTLAQFSKAQQQLRIIRQDYEAKQLANTFVEALTPTAASDLIEEDLLNKLGYDPLTVRLSPDSRPTVRVSTLRYGDDVVGESFGRLVKMERAGEGVVRVTLQRGETRREYDVLEAGRYLIRPIRPTPRTRSSVPPALSLLKESEKQEKAEQKTAKTDYDPLKVKLKDEEVRIRTDELRLGDNITGQSFGRVTKIEPLKNSSTRFTITMINSAGKTNTEVCSGSTDWYVQMIDVPDRESIPVAAAVAIPF